MVKLVWFPSLRRSSSSSVFQVGVPITHEQLLIVPSFFLLPKFQPKFLFPFYAHVAIAIPILSPSLYLYLQARLYIRYSFLPKKARYAKIGPQLTRFARITIASVPFFAHFFAFHCSFARLPIYPSLLLMLCSFRSTTSWTKSSETLLYFKTAAIIKRTGNILCQAIDAYMCVCV